MKTKQKIRSIAAVLAWLAMPVAASGTPQPADARHIAEPLSGKASADQEIPEPSAAAFVGAVGLFLLLRRGR